MIPHSKGWEETNANRKKGGKIQNGSMRHGIGKGDPEKEPVSAKEIKRPGWDKGPNKGDSGGSSEENNRGKGKSKGILHLFGGFYHRKAILFFNGEKVVNLPERNGRGGIERERSGDGFSEA